MIGVVGDEEMVEMTDGVPASHMRFGMPVAFVSGAS